MNTHDLEKQRYPIGKFARPTQITPELLARWIDTLEKFPSKLRLAVETLTDEQLSNPYRPGGWTIRQVVHHCADSHLNSTMRFKLALTEESPTIKPYLEAKWAMLPDMEAPIEWSLKLIEALHQKWVFLLRGLTPDEFKKTYYHPEQKQHIPLDVTVSLYAWHCEHHLGHIKQAVEL